jgi:precorrin-6B methylase 2
MIASAALESLEDKLRGKGWQPSRAEMAELFDLLATGDRDQAELAERALARRGREAAEEGVRRFVAAKPPLRGRLIKLVGRFAADFREFLLATLADGDAKSRRNAVIALGKLGGPEVEAGLRARWPQASLEERRSLGEALGKIGGTEALALFADFHSEDPELERIVAEARLKLSRTLGRSDSGRLDAEAIPPAPLSVVFRCREGLGALVVDEVKERLGAAAHILDPETVAAKLQKPLSALQSVRTALHFAFPLPTGGASDPGDAVVAALTSEPARVVFSAFTRGPARYRIEWASGGHRRGLTFRSAERIARKDLINDPTASLWEAVVDESHGIRVELWPRGLDDARFDYRVEQVPASSHPTLAAALARLGGARPDDVVWDPFVGGGTELVERARLGPFKKLLGTDLDDAALERAKKNLAAAAVDAELLTGDARKYRPRERPTLIITNPPMGRRVLNKQLTGALYDEFLAHAANVLAPGGRLVWISPRADDTVVRAKKLGFEIVSRQRIDMAGFWAELQAFRMGR